EYLPLFAADKGGLTHVEVRFIATAEGTLLQLEEAETRDLEGWTDYQSWMSEAWNYALQQLKLRAEGV
ncbi:MAG: hypothetical protein JRH20_17580, partial [Deltaproteobacteria bacterium]|nr:hypothetical protein [Deltaproteobacteria bacterium]